MMLFQLPLLQLQLQEVPLQLPLQFPLQEVPLQLPLQLKFRVQEEVSIMFSNAFSAFAYTYST